MARNVADTGGADGYDARSKVGYVLLGAASGYGREEGDHAGLADVRVVECQLGELHEAADGRDDGVDRAADGQAAQKGVNIVGIALFDGQVGVACLGLVEKRLKLGGGPAEGDAYVPGGEASAECR